MGRQSPGKWIRNLFLGKKSSKSKSSKEKDIYKPSSKKDVMVVSSEASISHPTVISPPSFGISATKEVLSTKEVVSISSNERVILSIGDKQANAPALVNFGSGDHHEKIRQTEAAITVQAAVRGCLARTTFQTLKCIIPLQAHIRGQLVRRQAVSALYCVNAIVKFQALARGYKVRHSGIGLAVQKICKVAIRPNSIGAVTSTQAAKLSANIFVNELLASSTSAVLVYLKFIPGEPNLSRAWLDRWTKSHFWAPHPELKKPDSMSDKKNGTCQTIETNEGQVKRNARKASAVRVGNDSASDSNKNNRHPRKDSKLPLHSAKEHPQKEQEKKSFKKAQIQNAFDKSEVSNNENSTNMTRKDSDHTVNDIPEKSSEKMNDLTVSRSKQFDHTDNESCKDNNVLLQPILMNVEDGGVIEDLNIGDSCMSNVSFKNCQRRASLPANFMDHENLLHNTPRLPSYMAPTESTKAKLRGQGSPRFATDFADKNSITRRLSLSSSLNGKLGSFSPRSDRLAALSSKGMIRSDRSLSSSRDGTDKLIQPQWRR
ncbi:protein IQ-DOMAIN 31-like [Abrus precatorius]|uniref:Protein IQ-DOMAIN 31-like n=1 Tax=Abrus precatorius TaxID=3816 RepID=A0A8B8KV06_ABRPR|nr:protein IQ-DOMAIN 31-like [Abrus precatorius]